MENETTDFVWQRLALCLNIVGKRKDNGEADDPLFDNYESSTAEAQAVDEMCKRCPVRRNCLFEGVEGKQQGVWGGVYLTNGKPDQARNAHKTEEDWQEIRELIVS